MRKTLIAVLVFCVALLVAPPAQAKPVKQRATNAAYCYEVFGPDSERVKQEIAPADLAKCEAVINRHVGWLEAKYPSVMYFGIDALPEPAQTAGFNDFLGRLGRAYRVTQTQIKNAYPLRYK